MKNIFILFLVTAAVYQTGTLWLEDTASHNFFYTFFYSISKDGNNSIAESAIIDPARMILGYGNKKYSVIYPRKEHDKIQQQIEKVLKEVIENGEYQEKTEADWDRMLSGKVVICDYSFSVASSEYSRGIRTKSDSFSSYVTNFDSIVIVPARTLSETVHVYFVNRETKEAVSYIKYKSAASVELYQGIELFQQENASELLSISTKQNSFHLFAEDTFVPQWTQSSLFYHPLKKENPFGDQIELEQYMEGFFPNFVPEASQDSNGISTFSNENTVVKYDPAGILEYYDYSVTDSRTEQTVSTAYYACTAFLKKDQSLFTDIYLSDVQLTSEGLIFCYDYTVSDFPVFLSQEEKERTGMDYAIEIVVKNNMVKKYRRYAYNFIEDKNSELILNIDFITALNSVMSQYTGEKIVTQIDKIELGYFVNEKDKMERKWFLVMDGILYVCDSFQ